MTIKVKLGDLVAANGALADLGALTDLPPSTNFRVSRVIRKSKDELREWNDQRHAIMRASGKAAPHPQVGGELWVDPKGLTMAESDALDAKMRDLNETEIELDASEMKLSEFGDKAVAKITSNVLADLHWLITGE